MAECVDCEAAARRWQWGGYASSCRGCTVRALAKSPKMLRRAGYLRLAEPADRPQLMADVKAEAQRIAALRAEQGPLVTEDGAC